MVIDRNKHNKYSTNQIYGTQSQQQQTEQAGSGSNSGTTIIYQGGGSGLTEEQKKKLDSIEEGAQVNQNAFSKVTISDGSITNEITANDPSDNVTFQGVSPIKLSLIDGVIQISYDGVSLWQVDEDGNLWTDRNVYSTKEISAYGYGDGEQPTGAQYLYELKDVDSSSATKPIDQGILQYDSATGKWVVTDGSNIKPDLTGYATQSWVTEQLNLLIGSAPDVLDTIYEIAEALNNDPDYVKDIANNLSNLTNRVVKLEDMFEWDGDKIKAKADLYGIGEISAYGYGSGEAPTGAQYLYELKDVTLTEITAGQLLQWDGLKWVNINKDEVGLNESELNQFLIDNNYAKISDITWDNVLNKPDSFTTSISDITDLNQNWYTILNIEPTDYVTRWPQFSEITNKPNTLEGYGITDAISITDGDDRYVNVSGDTMSGNLTLPIAIVNTRIQLGDAYLEYDSENKAIKLCYKDDTQTVNFYATGEISAYGYGEGTPGGGASNLSELEDVSLTELAVDDMLKWNGEKWVNIPMSSIAGVSSWDEITDKPSWIGDTKPSYTFAEITSKPTTLAGYGITDAVTIGTEQTITGAKTFSANSYFNEVIYSKSSIGIILLYDTDSSRVRSIAKTYDTSNNETSSITYHNTAKRLILNSIGADSIYNDAVGKYSFVIGNNELKYNTYNILHTGNYSTTLDTRYVLQSSHPFIYRNAISIASGYPTADELDTIKETGSYRVNYAGASGALHVFNNGGGSAYYTQIYHKYNGNMIWRSSIDSTLTGIAWKTLLDSSNYSSTLDTRYVKKAGDTMTSGLNINSTDAAVLYLNSTSSIESAVRFARKGTVKSVAGYHDSKGAYLYSYPANKYLNITDGGLLQFGDYTVWHAGNDGSGSGLDADLLDGVHKADFVKKGTRIGNIDWNALKESFLYDTWSDAWGTNTPTGVYKYGQLVVLKSYSSVSQLYIPHQSGNGGIRFRMTWDGTDTQWDKEWRQLALITDNVASATKLQTPRTIWGQSFDGTKNVDGKIKLTTWDSDGLAIRLENSSATTGYISIYTYPSNAYTLGQNATRFVISHNSYGDVFNINTGNVGIGTTSPSSKLHVVGNSFFDLGDATLKFYAADAGNSTGSEVFCLQSCFDKQDGQTSSYPTSSGTAYRVSLSLQPRGGCVGIGTITPGYNLHVSGTMGVTGKITATNGINVTSGYVTLSNGWFQNTQTAVGMYNSANDARWFANSNGWSTDKPIVPTSNNARNLGTSSLRWSNVYSVLGNFSGAVTMSSTLNVGSYLTTNNEIIVNHSNAFRAVYGNYGFFIRNDGINAYFLLTNSGDKYGSYNSLRPFYINNSNGFVTMGNGFGTTTGNFTGTVVISNSASPTTSSTAAALQITAGGLYVKKVIRADGNIFSLGEVTAYSSSDIRLKTNLKELKAINTLRKINTFEYDWTEEALNLKTNKNKHDYGIIAQELIEIIPEAVTTNMYDKGYYGIDYVKLIPFTISAIKEVDDEVTTLKNRVKELEERLSKYESNIK